MGRQRELANDVRARCRPVTIWACEMISDGCPDAEIVDDLADGLLDERHVRLDDHHR